MYYYKSKKDNIYYSCPNELKRKELVKISKSTYDRAITRPNKKSVSNWLKIAKLSKLISDSAVYSVKYSLGQISDEEYAKIKIQRQIWIQEQKEIV